MENAPDVNRQSNTYGMLVHLLGLAGLVFPLFGSILGPLILWMIKKDEFPFVNEQGKEAINFQISVAIYSVISAILIFIVIGIVLLVAIQIFWLVLTIVAAINANDGKPYRYPLTIRFIQ